jgi:hypothetical protein
MTKKHENHTLTKNQTKTTHTNITVLMDFNILSIKPGNKTRNNTDKKHKTEQKTEQKALRLMFFGTPNKWLLGVYCLGIY